MEEILHQLIGSFSDYLQGLLHLRWLFGISPINSITILRGNNTWKAKCPIFKAIVGGFRGKVAKKKDTWRSRYVSWDFTFSRDIFFRTFIQHWRHPKKPRWIKLRPKLCTVSGFLNPCLLAINSRFPTGHQPKHL